MASLTVLAWATSSAADTTIGSGRATPVATSSAAAGAPDNVVITSGGAVKPPSGAAVTLDSDNTVSNSGTIQIQDQSNATGILVQGGHAGAATNAGTVTINETATATDSNGDGNLDGPFARGADRFGIRVTGDAPFVGTITNDTTGVITVQGDDSAGVSVESSLQGSLSMLGGVSVVGSRTIGVSTQAVTGDILVGGTVSAQGEAAQGLHVGGDVGGQVLVQGAVTATGYRYSTRSTDTNAVAKLGADDLLQGGPVATVAADVARGILVDLTGSLTSSGSAPGLLVGSQSRSVTLGNVGTGVDAYGLEIRGAVSGLGVYDGVSATGVQLGIPGGGAVDTGGGVHVTGSITAAAAEGGATGVLVNSGVRAPLFQNDGSITASASAVGAVNVTSLLVRAGANVPAFANSWSLTASVAGAAGDAVALQDLSGSLTSIQNIAAIAATVTPAAGVTATGKAVAIDVSANTSGVNLLQYDTSGGLTPPSILGAIRFGSGADNADIQAGTVTGDLSFGAGANTLSISGGANVTGALTANGGTLALSVGDGALQINSTDHLDLRSLSLGSGSTLVLTLDPTATADPRLQVAGSATVASGAKIGLRFASLLQGSASYTLIQANQLSVGSLDTTLLGSIPYLYNVAIASDAAQGSVTAQVIQKSAAEIGLTAATAAAYAPTVAAIDRDTTLRNAILAQTDRTGFLAAFNQLLPNRSSAVFQLVAAQVDATGRTIDDRQGAGGGAWVQELNFGASDRSRDGIPGYRSWGVGLIGGYEAALSPMAILGFDVGASSSQVRELASAASSSLVAETYTSAVYWRGALGRFSANARAGGGYLRMSSDREIAITNVAGATFGAGAGSHWSGSSLNARVRLAYEADLGFAYLRPEAAFDYVSLSEGAHTETGGGAVDLSIEARHSTRSSGFAGFAIGKTFGDEEGSWGPELLLGYRTVVSETLADTRASFVSGGDSFTIPGETIGGQGFAAHLAYKGENGYGGFALEGGGELRDGLAIYDLRLAAHLQF